MIETRRIALVEIDDSRRLRPVSADWAAVMADDVRQGAELPLILVRPVAPGELRDGCRYELVIGGHRVEAHRLAGRAEIRADVEEMSRDEAIIREAEENLKRNEPSALDLAIFYEARAAAHARLHPETKRGGDRRSAAAIKRQTLPFEGAISFATEAAERVGLGERTIRGYIQLGRKLSPAAVPILYRTGLARNATELQKLAEHPPEKQVRLAKAVEEGRAATVAAALVAEGEAPAGAEDPQERIFQALMANWERASKATRARLCSQIGLVLDGARP